MKYECKLFRQSKKSESGPDWKGPVEIGGKKCVVSGWERDGYLHIEITEPFHAPRVLKGGQPYDERKPWETEADFAARSGPSMLHPRKPKFKSRLKDETERRGPKI